MRLRKRAIRIIAVSLFGVAAFRSDMGVYFCRNILSSEEL
jgi:hypothetical protein